MAVGLHTFTVVFSGLFKPKYALLSIIKPNFEKTFVLFTNFFGEDIRC